MYVFVYRCINMCLYVDVYTFIHIYEQQRENKYDKYLVNIAK